MNNADLIALRDNLDNLRLQRSYADEAVAKALSDLRNIDKQIEEAGRVTDVIDGVCLHVAEDHEGRWYHVQTLLETEQAGTLHVNLYEMAHSKPYWAVRINEIGPKNRCVHNYERWFGGFVIGLGQTMSYDDAKALALKWLLGNGKLP